MVIDWLGFGYAATIALGGYMGYKRKGSLVSLIAGLLFGSLSAYGAILITNDPSDQNISFLASGTLAVVMGIRFKRSGKIMPAGIMAGLSLLRILQLFLFTL